MRLAFSTNAYLRHRFDEAARRIATIGYQGLELMADVPHAWPAHLPESQKQAILEALKQNGLQLSNVNAFMMNAISDHRQPYWHPSFLEADRHYRQVRIDHTQRALSLAAELGAPHISAEPGGPLLDGMTYEQGMTQFAEILKPLCEHAHKVGVILLIEPEPGLLLETTDQYLELADRVDSPAMGLNFDIGHAYCMGEDIPAQIAKLAQHTRHYHVEDIAATRVHHHLVPGTGAIGFAPIFEAIARTDYREWITVELYPFVEDPDEAARQAFALLQPLLSKDATNPAAS